MKAVRIHEDGGPEVLRYEDVPDPEPAPGEVLIRLRAASLNHLDVWVRRGLPSVPKPRILGADGAGVVEALGEGVDGFAPGDRVVINPGLEHGDDHGRRRAHGRHALRADRVRRRAGVRARRAAVVRSRRRRSRSSTRPPTGCSSRAAGCRRASGCSIWGIGGGVATAAFEICARARCAHDRHVGLATRSSNAHAMGRRRRRQPRRRRRRRRRARRRPATAPTWWSRPSARRPGRARWPPCGRQGASSSAARRAARTRRRSSTGSGGSSSTCSARRWARARTSSAPTSSSAGPRPGPRRLGVPARPRSRAAHERLEAGEQLGKIVLSIPGPGRPPGCPWSRRRRPHVLELIVEQLRSQKHGGFALPCALRTGRSP